MFIVNSKSPHLATALRETAATLRGLADDLDRIAAGSFPAEADLDAAPLLTRYQPSFTLTPVLCGDVTGHPKLPGTNRTISTSPLWALDAEAGWARTNSRLYRLGRPSSRADERVN